MTRDSMEMIWRLREAGITLDDALRLRRIAMTLHRWHELECGTGNGHIERDEATGTPYYYNANARYVDPHDPRARHAIRDSEKGALKRLAAIMARYPHLHSYVQGDPRGAPLYILPADVDANNYTRGIAVYK